MEMSEKEMNRLSEAMKHGYNGLIRFAEITKKGNIDEFQSNIAYAFGLSWRTAKERIDFLKASKIIIVEGKLWKWVGNNKQNVILLNCISDPKYGSEVKTEEEIRKSDTDALIEHIKFKGSDSI